MTSHDPAPEQEPIPILLVEDDLDQAFLLRFLLEATGEYRVTLVQDGVGGVRMAEKGGWSMVITDLNLPGTDGSSVVEASRHSHPRTPILVTTGFVGPEYAEAALARGADEVLQKPLDRDDVLRKVARLVAGAGLAASASDPEPTDGTMAATSEALDKSLFMASSGASVPLRILAIGLRPSEIERGCGGVLLRHADRGDRIVLVILSRRGPGAPSQTDLRERARSSARRLGARFFVGHGDPEQLESFEAQASGFIEAALREIDPDVLYVPTAHREDTAGALVGALVEELASGVPRVMAYDPGDATTGFAPSTHIPLGPFRDGKAALLELVDPAGTASNLSGHTPTSPGMTVASPEEPAEAFESLHEGMEALIDDRAPAPLRVFDREPPSHPGSGVEGPIAIHDE